VKNFLLSCVVPFKDYVVLHENLLKSLIEFTDCVEVILVHDTKLRLNDAQIDFLKSIPAEVTYISGEYKSAAKARNEGLARARGEWIIFWDSDDYGFTDEVLGVIKGAGSNELVICDFRVTESIQGNVNQFASGRLDLRQLVRTPGIWRHIFRRKLIGETRFQDICLGEDILFLVECGAYEKQILFSEEIVYEYRLSSSQATKNMDLSIELKRFLNELSKSLQVQQPISPVPYGIYIRQTVALILHNKGKYLIKYLKDIFNLYRRLGRESKRIFRKSIIIALAKKGLT